MTNSRVDASLGRGVPSPGSQSSHGRKFSWGMAFLLPQGYGHWQRGGHRGRDISGCPAQTCIPTLGTAVRKANKTQSLRSQRLLHCVPHCGCLAAPGHRTGSYGPAGGYPGSGEAKACVPHWSRKLGAGQNREGRVAFAEARCIWRERVSLTSGPGSSTGWQGLHSKQQSHYKPRS